MEYFNRRILKYLYAIIWENFQVWRLPGLLCLVLRKFHRKILKRAQTQTFVECSDNWEMPTFQCRAFPLFCSWEATYRRVTEQAKANILCAVKYLMLTLWHSKHITVRIHVIVPHITPKLCPALLHAYLLPRKYSVRLTPASTKLRYISFHLCWHAQLWTPNTWLLVIQKVY
jgi:hypothetical protein